MAAVAGSQLRSDRFPSVVLDVAAYLLSTSAMRLCNLCLLLWRSQVVSFRPDRLQDITLAYCCL